jgi:hypothetical protein
MVLEASQHLQLQHSAGYQAQQLVDAAAAAAAAAAAKSVCRM